MKQALPLLLLAACGTPVGDDPGDTGTPDEVVPRGEAPQAPPPASLKRLTAAQYRNVLADLFGPDLVLPGNLEPDARIEGLVAVGAARTTISPYGADRYAEAAYSIASQVLSDPDRRDRWVGCTPSVDDDACFAEVARDLGLHAWRRPLTADEVDVVAGLAADAAATLDDAEAGLTYGLAYLLMSPHFLYRVELPTEGGTGPYTGHALASRLSFFLWNTLPDDALLQAAADGDLATDEGLAAQVDRMLADDRAAQGVRNLFSEMLHLDELDELVKDPAVFTYWRDSLRDSAREETLQTVEHLVFDDDGSYLDLYTTQQTFLNRELAALYDVPAPSRDGFGPVTLPDAGPRRGLLGQASFLALHAHAVSTSATRRGVFIREVVLCEEVPEPPANANTSIPEVSADAPTMRDRIAVHLENPSCAGCHQITDPIGLGFETFDGLGRARVTENGVPIDPSGDLDGADFSGPWELAAQVAAHPHTVPCFAETVARYATGAVTDDLDPSVVDWHAQGFAEAGHRVLWLMRDIALSPTFRDAGEVSE